MRKRIAAAGTVAVAAVLLAACTSGHQSSKSGGGAVATGGGQGSVPKAQAANAANGPAQYGAARAPAGAMDAGSTGGLASGKGTLLEPTAVIRTASITVRVKQISAAEQVRAIAEGAGGTVDGDDRTSGTDAVATLTLAVPPARLGDVLTRIAGLGTEKSRQMSSQDVTQQVTDVDSRVRSARDSIDRLRLLFTKATRVGDIIAIENELSTRQADLESLLAQQRTLAEQTTMAHVTAVLTTTEPATKKKHHDKTGFVGGIDRGWDAFGDASAALLTGLGAILPFALLLAVLGAAAYVPLRRYRQRTVPPAPPVPDAA
ncbi:MAG TPA: DUF4349 domain-containing protein [Jatrophihabitantaceae bacterium]|nr:DUF4349 domain-containing protein [Jatrophihabitantaceae bacterium]